MGFFEITTAETDELKKSIAKDLSNKSDTTECSIAQLLEKQEQQEEEKKKEQDGDTK